MKIMSYRGITLFTFCAMVIVLMAGCPMLTAPPAMYSPTLTAGSEQLTALWVDPTTWNWGENNAGNAITAYNLRYGEVGSEGWTEIISGITGASHTITDLTNGVNYAVQVRAVNAQGTGGWSASATATPIAPTAPPAPPGTMAAPTLYAGTGRLVATWTAPIDNGSSPITGYELQYRTGGGAWTQITEGITGTDHSITGLTNGSPYQVQVSAVNAVGDGPWSPFTIGRPQRTQTPVGTARVVSLSDAVNVIIASENLSIYLTTVESGTYAVDESGNITVTPATTPDGVTIPTVNANTGIVTVTAGTTAGTYLVYGETESGDKLFAEYFYVTVRPHDGDGTGVTDNDGDGGNDELDAAVATGITTWGQTADLNYIVTAAVTDMSLMFNNNSVFNGDISGWDVSSVTNISAIFSFTDAFNGDISAWDVSSVMNMSQAFQQARAFNRDISAWEPAAVTNMNRMFKDTGTFNQDLEEWKDHLTLDANGKFTGNKTNMFRDSGLDSNPNTNDDSGPQPNYPSWY